MFKSIALSVFSLFFLQPGYAGHEKGGVILSYKSVAGVNNNPLEYVLEAYAIYESGPIPAPSSISVVISSSCFSTSSVNLPRIGSVTSLTSADYCTPGTNIGATSGMAYFRDTVTLPGTCSDFKFSHTAGPGRYFLASNVDDNFSGSAYFEVHLDNTLGPNSCPNLPNADFAQGLCINQPLILYGFSENDGDSLYFSASAPQRIASGSVSNFPYKTGYSQSNQFGVSLAFTLNPSSGILSASIGAQGTYVVTIRFREYRQDSTGTSVEIADGRFSMLAIGASTCSVPQGKIKYPSVSGSDSILCGSTDVDIAVSRRIATSTLASDGSDFIIFDQNGPLSVQGAQALSDTIIRIKLSQPLAAASNLSVTTDTGSDGNVLVSVCGNHFIPLTDTLDFYAVGASSAQASFSYTTNLLQVSFNGQMSMGDSLVWDFGDGSIPGGGINPVHNYANSGTYLVVLKVYDDCGSVDSNSTSITVCDSLVATFSSLVQNDSILFTANINSAANVYWDFGDGNSDSGQNVVHSYAAPGSYYVIMTAINACGDTVTAGDTIKACDPPVSSWTYQLVSTGGSGMVIDFDGTASANAVSWLWDFGDGNTNSVSLTPTHTYVTPGLNYRVSLSVTNSCGETSTYAYRLDQIGTPEFATQIKFYPNPASSELRVEWEHRDVSSGVVRLFNANAMLVKSSDFQGSDLVVDVEDLQPGMYILELESSALFIRKSFIVTK